MRVLIEHIRRNAVGYVALFVALGGTGYAAANLPRDSVGARQLKNHSIAPVKLDPKFFGGDVRAWAIIGSGGQVVAGGGKPRSSAPPVPGNYEITWGVTLNRTCATVATIDPSYSPVTENIPIPGNPSAAFTAGYAVAESFSDGRGRFHNVTGLHTFNQQGQLTALGFDVVVTC